MPPTLVLDTNTLADRDFIHWLRSYPGRKILPAVAYAEIGVLYRSRGKLRLLDQILADTNTEIEWMRDKEARRAIETGVQVGDFAKNARDHLIGAHAHETDRVFVTRNSQDFTFLRNVRTPLEAQDELG